MEWSNFCFALFVSARPVVDLSAFADAELSCCPRFILLYEIIQAFVFSFIAFFAFPATTAVWRHTDHSFPALI